MFPFDLGRLGNGIALWLGIRPYELFFYIFLPPILLDAAIRIDFFLFKKVSHTDCHAALWLSCPPSVANSIFSDRSVYSCSTQVLERPGTSPAAFCSWHCMHLHLGQCNTFLLDPIFLQWAACTWEQAPL